MRGARGLWALAWLLAAGCSQGPSGTTAHTLWVEAHDLQHLAPEAPFVSVRDLAVGPESIWVLDAAPPFVTRISLPAGRVTRFGREGRGPGEFLSPCALQATPDPGTPGVVAWDPGNLRVLAFDTLGTLTSSEALDGAGTVRARSDLRNLSYVDPFRVRAVGNHVVLATFPARIDRTADMADGRLRLADPRLSPETELARFAHHMDGGASSLREWVALPLWDVCDGGVVLWSPGSSRVIWLDLEGTEIGSAAVPEPTEPVSLEDVERYLRWMGRLEMGPDHEAAGADYPGMARAVRERFAERRPVATDLRCQPGGVAWLRLFDTSADPLGSGQVWLKVPMGGKARRVGFPPGFIPMGFEADGAYGVLEVPQGHQVLAWWGEEPGA